MTTYNNNVAPAEASKPVLVCPGPNALAVPALALADRVVLGAIPPLATLFAILLQMTDLDTGVAALAGKIQVNGVDWITGLTDGQAASHQMLGWGTAGETPVTGSTTQSSLVEYVVTTAPATGAAGTITATLFFYAP